MFSASGPWSLDRFRKTPFNIYWYIYVLLILDNIAALLALTMVGRLGVAVAFALMYLYTAEVNPTVLRSVGLSTASTAARIGGMCAPIIADLVII